MNGASSARMSGSTRPVERVDPSPAVSDTVKSTTSCICACRGRIRVHLRDGRIRYVEGNPDHSMNHGVICARSSAGIMQHYSPARLSKPLLRVGERGAGDFKEIEWEEALNLAARVAGKKIGAAILAPIHVHIVRRHREALFQQRPAHRPRVRPRGVVKQHVRLSPICRS